MGGGIYNIGTANLTNSTISGNSCLSSPFGNQGGGIYNQEGYTVTVRNTIIAKNAALGGPDVGGALISLGFNLIGDNSGSTFPPATGDQIGTSASPIDPLLGQLADNGGPSKTQALLSGSTAIDQGNSFGSTTDQRGQPRPYRYDPTITEPSGGDGSDMGAFEVNPIPTPTPTPSPTPTPTPTPTPAPTNTPTPTPSPSSTPTPTPVSIPKISLSVSPMSIRQGDTAFFTVTASSANPNAPVTINYSMKGKALFGTNYSLSGTYGRVTIPAGATSASVTLNAIPTVPAKKGTTATMTLQSGIGYAFSSRHRGPSATIAIANAAPTPTPTPTPTPIPTPLPSPTP